MVQNYKLLNKIPHQIPTTFIFFEEKLKIAKHFNRYDGSSHFLLTILKQ